MRRLHGAHQRHRHALVRDAGLLGKGPITTLEGLARNGTLHPIQQAWIDEQVPACGYCQNGQMLTAVALLQRNPRPTDAQIREAMAPRAVPVLHVLPDSSGRASGGFRAGNCGRGRKRSRRRTGMNSIDALLDKFAAPTRRDFLKTSGRLVVGFSCGSAMQVRSSPSRVPRRPRKARRPYPDPDFRQLDSWIVIHQDNTATFYVGKTDLGQGTGTAFRQIMSDELDMAFDRTTCIMGNTDITVDQGGSGGSDALQTDGYPMRRVAAEARRVLLDMASRRFGVPVDQLAVSDGVVTMKADPGQRVTYGELIGGNRFNVSADRRRHQRHHRHREDQAGAGDEERRPLSSSRRHSGQGGCVTDLGRRRESARHGARAKCQTAGRRRGDGERR